MYDRMRALGIPDERIAGLGIRPPTNSNEPRTDGLNPAGIAEAARRETARVLAERALRDVLAWRKYRDAPDPFTRASMGHENLASIERGRLLDEDVDGTPAA